MKGVITITRTHGENKVVIKVEDKVSQVEFLEFEMTAEAFGLAVTGVGCVAGEFEVRGLANVGKQRVTERRTKECPLTDASKAELEAWLVANAQEEGWRLLNSLDTKDSCERRNGQLFLHYWLERFVS